MSPLTSLSEASAFSERRVHLRFPCSQAVFCCALNPRDYIFWTARARDISASGMRLVLGHHFDPGTMLAMELLSAAQNVAREFPARVVYATAQAGGSWIIGCQFTNRLNEAELVALL